MTSGVYLDTNILIAAFETDTGKQSSVWAVLEAVEQGAFTAYTSQITLAELLPQPIANSRSTLVKLYRDLFAIHGFFDAVPITIEVLTEAAQVRADYRSVKLPDAIHLATARLCSCKAIFTADKRLDIIAGLTVVTPRPDSLDMLRVLTA